MFYIGQSVDVEERLKQHNSGFYAESSTKKANDWMLFWSMECESKKQAILIVPIAISDFLMGILLVSFI